MIAPPGTAPPGTAPPGTAPPGTAPPGTVAAAQVPPATIPAGQPPAVTTAIAQPLTADPTAAGLVELARAQWPETLGDTLPAIPGFVISSFSPLVAELAQRCLRRYFGAAPADPVLAERTGVLLASTTGDLGTAAAIAQAVDEGRRVPPLLFFQSNPNAVVGYLTARWGLSGPVVATIPVGDAMADAQQCAAALIADGDADAVLIIVADQARGPDEQDHGEALLVGPRTWPAAAEALSFPVAT